MSAAAGEVGAGAGASEAGAGIDEMREKLAALLRSSVCAPAQHNTEKLHNGAITPVLVFPDEG